MGTFYQELKNLLNRYNKDSELGVPDHILADYLIRTLENYKQTYQASQRSMAAATGDSHGS